MSDTHLWSSFSASLGTKKRDAGQGLCAVSCTAFQEVIKMPGSKVQTFLSQYATEENLVCGKKKPEGIDKAGQWPWCFNEISLCLLSGLIKKTGHD